MSCPPYNDRLCEIQYLLDGLREQNEGVFLPTLLATLVGAVVALFGSLYLHYLVSKRDDKVQKERSLEAKRAENAKAMATFFQTNAEGRHSALWNQTVFMHFQQDHTADQRKAKFPDGKPDPELLQRITLDLSAATITSNGIVRELFRRMGSLSFGKKMSAYPMNFYSLSKAFAAVAMKLDNYATAEDALEALQEKYERNVKSDAFTCGSCKKRVTG